MATIQCMVTWHKEKAGGEFPIIFVESEEELQTISKRLEKMLDSTAHELLEGMVLIVDHKRND